MSVFIGLFWSLFVHDFVGDTHPSGGTVSAVMMIATCPSVFISSQKILAYLNTDSSSNSNDYKSYINDVIEKVSQAVHNSIWKFLHSILIIKEIVKHYSNTNNDNDNDDDNNIDENRNSTMTETISPLRSLRI